MPRTPERRNQKKVHKVTRTSSGGVVRVTSKGRKKVERRRMQQRLAGKLAEEGVVVKGTTSKIHDDSYTPGRRTSKLADQLRKHGRIWDGKKWVMKKRPVE